MIEAISDFLPVFGPASADERRSLIATLMRKHACIVTVMLWEARDETGQRPRMVAYRASTPFGVDGWKRAQVNLQAVYG